MDHSEIAAAVREFDAAQARGEYFPRAWFDRLTLDDAYRILLALIRRRGGGSHRIGWKVGLTAPAIQQQFGVHERCAIRDTRAAGDERYYWTVTVIGEPDPVAAGRTGDVRVARSLAELALGAYVANRSELSSTDDLGPSFPPKRFANALAASSSMNSTERTTSTPS